uniref:ras-related protein Rab-4A isoform X2 n=1 Tax=Ictidomys tridecemlineatus TaxID=43179 RepID=UPI001A9D4796|nr:ras-related protein Rab-4A isoform X2 [Ictidomys tridecemlineatus]
MLLFWTSRPPRESPQPTSGSAAGLAADTSWVRTCSGRRPNRAAHPPSSAQLPGSSAGQPCACAEPTGWAAARWPALAVGTRPAPLLGPRLVFSLNRDRPRLSCERGQDVADRHVRDLWIPTQLPASPEPAFLQRIPNSVLKQVSSMLCTQPALPLLSPDDLGPVLIQQDFLFKFLVIGNAGTGKSCLLHQFIEKKFKDDSNHTIGVEFGSKIINVGGKYVKLQIWDTAGQERFRSVTRSYYRGAAGALLVYDITSRETYNALTNWLTDARMLASQSIVILLCGNKKDLDTDREVTFLEASRFAQENELMFLETSALTGENVEEAFVQCARKILNRIESGELDPERMGSGIQYGDAALRQLRSPRRTQAVSVQECGC